MRFVQIFLGITTPLALTACAASIAVAADYSDVVLADAHVHLLDFLQNGDHLESGEIVEKIPGAALPAGQRGKRIEACDRTKRNGLLEGIIKEGLGIGPYHPLGKPL